MFHLQLKRAQIFFAARDVTIIYTVPGEAAPGEAAPGEAAPGEAVRGEAAPGDITIIVSS